MAKERAAEEKKKTSGGSGGAGEVFSAVAGAVKGFFASLWQAKLIQLLIILLAICVATASIMGFIIERETEMFSSAPESVFQRFIDSVYYTMVTMSTVGYGDFSPKTPSGKIWAIIIIFSGVICFSLMTATFASIRVARLIKEGREQMDLSKLKNHTIICGWKKRMEHTLEDIFTANPEVKPEELVVLANISEDTISMFNKQHPKFKGINFIRCEDVTEAMLNLANVAAAGRLFILADESGDASQSEIDSRTVMIAMSVSTLSRSVNICAELLDPKFESYLKKAHVSEIIYPNLYGRLILAQSTVSTGIVQVLNYLLDLREAPRFNTIRFPAEYVGKPYADLKKHIETERCCIAIGLVENVGSYFERKQEALREAQKTANISKLVDNLHRVKSLKNNHPVFNPPDDYVVPSNSMAVIIEVVGECK
ncbi:MAG: Voltage-gated potassium channel Kch [bacterium ADurb.Bin236]|nr:MAG: Voltage-gated potassium channel Kch [bacterium ADurb.Bin236]HOY63523.1 potassium channel family protein [bacterium]HPN95678.1 potassium channel family protein [bacterium]